LVSKELLISILNENNTFNMGLRGNRSSTAMPNSVKTQGFPGLFILVNAPSQCSTADPMPAGQGFDAGLLMTEKKPAIVDETSVIAK
jgi:hypothetical protein